MEKDIETKTTRDIGKDWNYSSNNHTERANKKWVSLEDHKKALEEQKKEIFDWSEEWSDNKRKSNDMWRVNQDELFEMFLIDFKKKHLKNREGENNEM